MTYKSPNPARVSESPPSEREILRVCRVVKI